ncbi:complement factor H-like isoform X3 [Poeciliopsis prolifica]|uniref:complement factor H-like isoform X3 n=1 Tax=Poeciliopsis prolifica TaxID=188132 RepID=UPI002413455D|nr:complement factor H-like isoform X3 [Poeciliopsis prolifica]
MKGLVDIGRQRKLLILCLFIGNVAADCPIPEHGDFTVLTEESILKQHFPDGTVITHECRLGYEKVSGTGKMTCVNGKWTELDIKCRRKDCGPPVPQPHMIFNLRQGTLYGAKAYITCEKGYTVMGWGYRMCLGTRWVGHGNCSIVNCSKPTKVENGEHTWRTRKAPHYNQKIHFSCHKGYTLIGNKTIRCTHTGRYDSKQPQCIAFCPIPDVGVNIILTKESLLKKDFPSGTELRYECIIGYKNVNGTGIMTCDDGNWTKPDIICRKKDCGHLEAQPHMLYDTSQGTLFGAAVYVSCVKGYRLNGPSSRQCLDTGWFGTSICEVVTCSKPTRVENGRHSWISDLEPEYRQTIHFTCNTEYTLFGNKIIRCTETGEYDSEPPRCVRNCPIPKSVENMVLTNESLLRENFPDGTKVTYECANGFEKESGSEIITCIDGTWTEPDLICKIGTGPSCWDIYYR